MADATIKSIALKRHQSKSEVTPQDLVLLQNNIEEAIRLLQKTPKVTAQYGDDQLTVDKFAVPCRQYIRVEGTANEAHDAAPAYIKLLFGTVVLNKDLIFNATTGEVIVADNGLVRVTAGIAATITIAGYRSRIEVYVNEELRLVGPQTLIHENDSEALESNVDGLISVSKNDKISLRLRILDDAGNVVTKAFVTAVLEDRVIDATLALYTQGCFVEVTAIPSEA